MIMAMQNEAARQGRAPEKFARTVSVLQKSGLTSELVGFVRKQREKLGLDALDATPEVRVDVVKKIFDETGINRLFEKAKGRKERKEKKENEEKKEEGGV